MIASMGKKYLVVSDNHGSMANLEYVIDRFHVNEASEIINVIKENKRRCPSCK